MLAVSSHSLPRIKESVHAVVSALGTVAPRCRSLLALLVGVKSDALGEPLAKVLPRVFESQEADWAAATREATFDRLRRWRREHVPDTTDVAQISIPYVIVALTPDEARAMRDAPDDLFLGFGEVAKLRQEQFETLRKRLGEAGLDWPDDFYTADRVGWRPFGKVAKSMDEFVDQAARRVNLAPDGSRERAVLRGARLVPLPYRFEEYVIDTVGSRDNLSRVCDSGCLVLLDEFSLLHPGLRPHVDRLLASNNAAVVSLSACDPTHRALRQLLDDASYLRVGNLLSRFRDGEDVRCELAVNSIERLQRWLRFVLPELMTTLGREQSDPKLVGQAPSLLGLGR
jgi:hypothetical protein